VLFGGAWLLALFAVAAVRRRERAG
jgi:hypothetical protein